MKMRPKDTLFFVLSASHNVFALDSGLRRNDGRRSLNLDVLRSFVQQPSAQGAIFR